MKTKILQFSIVIPTYNRPERLRQCLQSVAGLDYSTNDFEVIVVDDGSSTPLDSVTAEFDSCLSLQLIKQPNTGPASARNTGAAVAQGEYLVFTDDDCQPCADWLKALATTVKQFPCALIGGHTVNGLPRNPYSTASQLLVDYLYEYYNQTVGKANFFASNNFAMPRHLYQKVGGFDTNFPLAAGEDREFCDRWLQHGFAMYYAPAMQVSHTHTLALSSFWRQHFNYGRGAYWFHQIRGQRTNQRIKVEPFLFYFNLIIYPFQTAFARFKFQMVLLLVLSQIANVSGFLGEKIRGYKSVKASV